ncbi:MAG: hypothetical protein Q7J54_00880 [Candidatus Woesearchaeota archaeon]|nr:hypothetical protein [Candidatus Woesearchaeota archaeon]
MDNLGFDDLKKRYEDKIKLAIEGKQETGAPKVLSREYKTFKKELMPRQYTIYEQLCNISEKILRMQPSKKALPAIEESIKIAHLEVTPAGVQSFSLLMPLVVALLGSVFGFVLTGGLFFVMFFVMAALIMILPLQKIPEYLANGWRMKASNQMVLCVFYIVTYMRHTSNLELAIEFASNHLTPPLSLDLKKVLWDVETEKYKSVKDSMGAYLESWRKWNMEFIEAIHLIESSLYEGDEARRQGLLDKSLSVILEETYEKMLHYAHGLQSPITMLHMMGIILPILGLVILPLVVSFMGGVKWFHLAALYNIALPIAVFYMGKNILSQRPTGYGDTDISEFNPQFRRYKNIVIKIGKSEILISPIIASVIIASVLFIIGLTPIIYHIIFPGFDPIIMEVGGGSALDIKLLDYRPEKTTGIETGPYSPVAALFSLLLPLGLGIAIGIYFKLRSDHLMKIREDSKRLETEFASALFALGSRLGDGLPAEIAFGKVAEDMQGTVSGSFFQKVDQNIRRLGMSVQQAIFDPKYGALLSFPSNIIESSMKVLVESSKKGAMIAAQSLTNVSRYIKEIHKVDERLKDLMADIISSMKSQINFLTPVISGIVIGITAMITSILGAIAKIMPTVADGGQNLGNIFDNPGIPPYYFQLVVGIYIVQIIYLLTVLENGIENGSDSLNEKYLLGNNMMKSLILYCIVAAIITVIFTLITVQILPSLQGTGGAI